MSFSTQDAVQRSSLLSQQTLQLSGLSKLFGKNNLAETSSKSKDSKSIENTTDSLTNRTGNERANNSINSKTSQQDSGGINLTKANQNTANNAEVKGDTNKGCGCCGGNCSGGCGCGCC